MHNLVVVYFILSVHYTAPRLSLYFLSWFTVYPSTESLAYGTENLRQTKNKIHKVRHKIPSMSQYSTSADRISRPLLHTIGKRTTTTHQCPMMPSRRSFQNHPTSTPKSHLTRNPNAPYAGTIPSSTTSFVSCGFHFRKSWGYGMKRSGDVCAVSKTPSGDMFEWTADDCFHSDIFQ